MNDILTILKKIYSPVQIQAGPCKNERYLHHYFSHQLQTLPKYSITYNDASKNVLHPEWPTSKKEEHGYGTYRHKDKKIYKVDKNGSPGFIDFAIGNYNKPEIAIEFTVSSGWKKEEVIYDMMKLMDSRNPFQKVISYNIVFRKDNLPQESAKTYANFKNAINHSLSECQKRLKNNYAHNRKYFFWVIEIGDNETRSWYCGNSDGEFKPGAPV